MPLKPPALDPTQVPVRSTSGYPEPFRSRVLPREKRALGSALGLTQIGINLTTLPPGKESSMRHWHTHEDEFVFVISVEHARGVLTPRHSGFITLRRNPAMLDAAPCRVTIRRLSREFELVRAQTAAPRAAHRGAGRRWTQGIRRVSAVDAAPRHEPSTATRAASRA